VSAPRHLLHHTFRSRALLNQIDYSRDAAHDLVRIDYRCLTTCWWGQLNESAWSGGKLGGTHAAISIAEDAEEKSWEMSDQRS